VRLARGWWDEQATLWGRGGISLFLMSAGWRGESRNLPLRMAHESGTMGSGRMEKCRSDRETMWARLDRMAWGVSAMCA
jgi:hypothetical protein